MEYNGCNEIFHSFEALRSCYLRTSSWFDPRVPLREVDLVIMSFLDASASFSDTAERLLDRSQSSRCNSSVSSRDFNSRVVEM
jgi:hypothetical protein